MHPPEARLTGAGGEEQCTLTLQESCQAAARCTYFSSMRPSGVCMSKTVSDDARIIYC